MPAPTRAQIVADVTLPTFAVEIFTGGAWVAVTPHVVTASAELDASGGQAAGVALGPAVSPEARVELFADTPATLQTLRGYEADNLPVRITFGFDTSDQLQRFGGVLRGWGGEGRTRQWELRGWDALIEATEVRSPLFRRRPIATATTASSVENPASSTYAGGLVNYILWMCGGRPWEQVASYPSATFYYSASEALIAPEFTWIPGDSPWQVLLRLCKAAGGQIYQSTDGVVRYRDPITIATGTPAFTFSDEVLTAAQRVSQGKAGYATIADRHDSDVAVTGVTCTYVTRLVQGAQIVYEDRIPRQIAGGAALVLTCDTQLPLFSLAGAAVDAVVIRGAYAATASQVTVSAVLSSAQRVTVTVTNTLADPVMIDAVRITGRPVSAGEEGSASYIVSSARVVSVDDSPYIQSAAHAAMLCRMVYDAANGAGTIYELGGCGYDPDRFVGEVVGLTSSDYGLSALRCRIVSIRADGKWMDVELAPLGTLPTSSSVHLIGSVSGTKELAY
jgi:hypothetical protein